MKIAQEVLEVLNRAECIENRLILTGTLDRKLYMKVNSVLEECGGKWVSKQKAHVFEMNASDRIEQILLTGEVEIPKDDFDYFPTPSVIVERLIELADIEPGMSVLEPEAGQAAISGECLKAGGIVDCYELSLKNYEVLKTIHPNAILGDFLQVVPEKKYDRIVMNPPFGKQADIKHVNHALKFLKTSGRLVSVMASSAEWRDNKLTNEFRAIVKANGFFEKLPDESFKKSGTLVSTVIAVINN